MLAIQYSFPVPHGAQFRDGLTVVITEVAKLTVAMHEAGLRAEFIMLSARDVLFRFPLERDAVWFRLRFGGKIVHNAPRGGWTSL